MSQDAPREPLSELNFLDGYLRPRVQRLAHEGQRLWLVNCCWEGEITSALACARWADEQDDGAVSTLNLAGDEQTMTTLEVQLRRDRSLNVNLPGCLEENSERLLERIGCSPAFVMLDPLRDAGTRIDTLARLNLRRPARTDLLLTLTAQGLRSLTSGSETEHIDRVIGSSLWRQWVPQGDEQSNLKRISVLYRACLQRSGYTYARTITPRESGEQQGVSQLVFASASRTALSLVSDLACAYLRADHSTPALDELSERVCRLGAQLQSASSGQIIAGMACELFGRFTSDECRQVIGELARRGTIVASDPDRISDGQTLMFGATSQMALFDADPQG